MMKNMSPCTKAHRFLRIVSLLSFLVFLTILPNIYANLQTAISIGSYGGITYNNFVPLLGGWGGIRIYETVRATNIENGSKRYWPQSIVFPGEVASNAELTCLELKSRRYNAVRFIWQPATTGKPSTWLYNETWMDRAIKIAKALNMWIIIDCHAFHDHYQYENQWINEWYNIISRFKDSYEKIVWEPINEPCMWYYDGSNKLTGTAAVNKLAQIYQRWINICRGLGDTHWIVISNICWYDPHPWTFPSVNDPLNRIFLTSHFYMLYEYEMDRWTISEAQLFADQRFMIIINAINTLQRPFLCTEMGATPFSGDYDTPEEVPTCRYGGVSAYSDVSLAFVQRMITRMDNYSSRIGYILWCAGDWAKNWPEGWHYGGLYGGLDIWGQLLEYEEFQ